MKDKISVVSNKLCPRNSSVTRVFHKKFKILYIQFPEVLYKSSNGHRVHKLLLLTFYCRRI